MGFRTVVVKNRAKIETRLNWLLIRGAEEKWVHLDEIGTLIIESTACAITTQALCELAKSNINVLFCDEKHLPYGQMSVLYGNHLTSGQIRRQAQWDDSRKAQAWAEIIKQKIGRQQAVLTKHQKLDVARMLLDYASCIEAGDRTNREGHAAKVYFNALFGMGFGRRAPNDINAALNYGYAILLSSAAREIVAAGYCTQLGIHHINEFNSFNLASDLMEPFRPLVDAYILSIADLEHFKSSVTAVLTSRVRIGDAEQYLDAGIRLYVRGAIKFIENEGYMPEIQHFILEDGGEL